MHDSASTVPSAGAATAMEIAGAVQAAVRRTVRRVGWSGFMVWDTVVASLPTLTPWFIAAGGLLYSFGIIFHAWQRLRFQNAIWHGFVLLGAACHYTAVLDLVLT